MILLFDIKLRPSIRYNYTYALYPGQSGWNVKITHFNPVPG
jgi:hypothetical protein